MYTINHVVRGHNRHWLRMFNSNLKSLQIDFSQRTLGQHRIRSHTIILLIVAGKMFNRCTASLNALHTKRHSRCHHTGQKRILGIVLKVTATKWVSMDVHAWRQPQRYLKQFHLIANHLTELSDKLQIPTLCQKCTNWHSRAKLPISLFIWIMLWFFIQQKTAFK